jgi:ankyrin repeat protein
MAGHLFDWASSRGNELAMRVMVELGAEIDRQDNDGWTALIKASFYESSMCRIASCTWRRCQLGRQ